MKNEPPRLIMAILMFSYTVVVVVALYFGLVLRRLIGPAYEGFSVGQSWYRICVDFLDAEAIEWERLL